MRKFKIKKNNRVIFAVGRSVSDALKNAGIKDTKDLSIVLLGR